MQASNSSIISKCLIIHRMQRVAKVLLSQAMDLNFSTSINIKQSYLYLTLARKFWFCLVQSWLAWIMQLLSIIYTWFINLKFGFFFFKETKFINWVLLKYFEFCWYFHQLTLINGKVIWILPHSPIKKLQISYALISIGQEKQLVP